MAILRAACEIETELMSNLPFQHTPLSARCEVHNPALATTTLLKVLGLGSLKQIQKEKAASVGGISTSRGFQTQSDPP